MKTIKQKIKVIQKISSKYTMRYYTKHNIQEVGQINIKEEIDNGNPEEDEFIDYDNIDFDNFKDTTEVLEFILLDCCDSETKYYTIKDIKEAKVMDNFLIIGGDEYCCFITKKVDFNKIKL